MLALLLLGDEEVEDGGRAVVVRRDRRHAVGAPQAPHVRVLVGIDLGVGEPRGHIHDLVHARIAERARLQLPAHSRVTGACGSILPSATSMPASTPVNDFVTDIAICGLCGFSAPK